MQWVRYIDVSQNSPGVPADELIVTAPNSIPDPFWEDANMRDGIQDYEYLWVLEKELSKELSNFWIERTCNNGSPFGVALCSVFSVSERGSLCVF